MTNEQIEHRVKLVLQAQAVIREMKKEGLLRDSYKQVQDSALNTAMRRVNQDTTGDAE